MLTSALKAVRALSLGIWVGGGIMTLVTAQFVFAYFAPDREVPGNIMAQIFHFAGLLKLALAALALGTYFGLGKDATRSTATRKTGLIALVFAALIAVIVALYVEPRLLELRSQFQGDPNPNNPAHVLFRGLHGGSMGMALVELICVAIALICAVI